jgi:hypothetical protein
MTYLSARSSRFGFVRGTPRVSIEPAQERLLALDRRRGRNDEREQERRSGQGQTPQGFGDTREGSIPFTRFRSAQRQIRLANPEFKFLGRNV